MMKAQPPFRVRSMHSTKVLHSSESGSERSAQSRRRLRRFHYRERAETAVMPSPSSTSRRPVQAMEDRLSVLPKPILLRILSFLTTLDAVRTSVLSTRWRTLWTSVGVLDLDEDNPFFSPTGEWIRGTERERESDSCFVEFVGNVLSFHHTRTLHKMRLNCCSENFPLKDWVIRTAVYRGVQTLDISLPWNNPHPDGKAGRLPSLLFASQSLVDLRLDLGGSALILPGTLAALVGLRRMRLHRVKFYDDHRALFSSSTALRSLALENCYYRKLGCLEISCSSLRELVMESSLEGDGLDSCQVKIVAPQLSSFVYSASLAQSYVVESLLCVEYVKIQFQRPKAWEGPGKLSMFNRARSFLSLLSSARNLDICPVCVEVMRYEGVAFLNLNVLRTAVRHLHYLAIRVVLRLLASNPHLRALTVEVCDLSVLPCSAGIEDFFKFLGSWSLESWNGVVDRVEIRCSDRSSMAVTRCGAETVLELVKVLLGSQARLKKLILANRLICVDSTYHNSPSSRRDVEMEKVLSFPRRSRELAVAFI